MRICQICQVSDYQKPLENHHVVGRVGKDKHNPENIITLCNKCHWKWHNNRSQWLDNQVYRIMKSTYGDLFPIKVNGKPYKTKWIKRIEEEIERGAWG
jgi:5-methylcytosine-specific restriction endonuclease McrA